MSDREAMKEALRLLTKCAGVSRLWQVTDACDILRARLAAPSLAVTVDPRLTPDEATAISSALAAPRPEIQVMVDPAALTAAAAYVPVRIVTPDDAEIAQAAKFEKAYQNNRAAPPAAATEPVAKACWACNGKGYLRDIDTAGLLPCVVCKPQENKA